MYISEEIYEHVYRETSRIMMSVGIKANLDGYRYLRDTICLAVIKGKIPKNIQRELYEPIALHYGKKVHCIERAIRTAIETAWTIGDLDEIERFFGCSVDPNRAKPTAREFITRIAMHILADEKKYA